MSERMSIEKQIIRLASINAASRVSDLEKVHIEERKEILETLKSHGLLKLGEVFELVFSNTSHEELYRESYKSF
jgi:hypothetical protein